MNEIFKKGDTVYHWKYGKGTIETCYEVCAHVQCLGFFYIINYNELSFTPYTLPVDHVRPKAKFKVGDFVKAADGMIVLVTEEQVSDYEFIGVVVVSRASSITNFPGRLSSRWHAPNFRKVDIEIKIK